MYSNFSFSNKLCNTSTALAIFFTLCALICFAGHINTLKAGAPKQKEQASLEPNQVQEQTPKSPAESTSGGSIRETLEEQTSTQAITKKKLLHIGIQDIARSYDVKLIPYGFLRHETHWDTRQAFGSQEIQALILPQPFLPDRVGRDINAQPQFHMSPVQTRLGFLLKGPNKSEKVTIEGCVEADFRGSSTFSQSILTLRHMYSVINWQTGALLAGEFWAPLCPVDAWPRQLDFNSGAPFDLFARFPQFRLTQQFAITDDSALEVIAAATTQRDFQSNGPIGLDSSYIRNAVVPNLHIQFRSLYQDTIFGVAFDYKRLVPRLVSEKDYKVDEHVDSFITTAYIAFNTKPLSVRLKGIYAQNATEYSNLSGYAVATINPITDFRTYTPTANANFWLDINYIFPDDKTEVGLFAGYTKNLGASQKLFIDPELNQPIIFDLQTTFLSAFQTDLQEVDYAFRIAPRITYFWEPLLFGLEVEATAASWGKPDQFARVCNGRLVNDLHVLIIIDYVF